MDLFDQASVDEHGIPIDTSAPLAVRMRPRTIDEVVGQQHLLGPGQPLRRLIEPGASGAPSSVFLWGPPGIGKTTLAYLVARQGERRFVELSVVSAGVKELRAVIDEAKGHLVTYGQETVLFIDEVHRFSKTQQDALLPAVENGWVILIAATTENPSFSVISPLLSRSLLLTLHPLADSDVETLVRRALEDERGYGGKVSADDDAVAEIVRLAGNDGRRSLTILEAAVTGDTLTLDDVEAAVDVYAVRYDRDGDQHYDVISAFIKSIRGSDVDAAMHYLARMLEAGEDPRFIARRLMISAAEDIGMADPSALQTATAAAQSVALVGMPEARIILAEAVVHLATAPKSNRAYLAINKAIADVRAGKIGAVPVHLRDTSVKASKIAAEQTGKNTEYTYPFDDESGVVRQQYMPDELAGTIYYEPLDRGYEANITSRLARIRQILHGK
ncbi:replication-associated recombination protein A [Trueperella bialowiezensis]|uniref:Replication-associated recombination protein A n=1 Tax=Trueperella bialowiezensis TaxID=312285 RepID=A0A3S4YWL5_9ACTO|nr:replication-associated recombination protein A [Trueperella bialowiezensis]VEI12462.1 Replication-associated recombination protein A [Trueperella bialowiezensis]